MLAALAYARGAERATPRRFAVARESDDDDDDDDDDDNAANLRPRRNLANISSPDSSSPLTPSRAWFARSAFASRDVSASDWEAEEDAKRRFRAETAAAAAAARAKRALAAANAAADATETAVANARSIAEEMERYRPFREERSARDTRPPSSARTRPSPPPSTPRDATNGPVDVSRTKRDEPNDDVARKSATDARVYLKNAFAGTAEPGLARAIPDGTAKGASYSASAALVAARDALAGAAAAAAELTRAAARTPAAAKKTRSRRATDSETKKALGENADRRGTPTDASRLLRSSPSPSPSRSSSTRARRTRRDEIEEDPDPDDARTSDAETRASPKSPVREKKKKASTTRRTKNKVALDFSAETRRAMDAGRARRAELLAAYESVKQRCAAANATLKTSDDRSFLSDSASDSDASSGRRAANKRLEKETTPSTRPRPFVVPSREETLRLIRDMEDRARRAHERSNESASPTAPPTDPPTRSTERRAFEKHAGTRDDARRGLRKFRLPPSFEPFGFGPAASSFSREPPNVVSVGENASDDSDDSAGLTPPRREKDAARLFLSEEKQRVRSGPRLGLGSDVPGVEPELRVSDVRDFESLVAYAFQ